MRCPCPAPEELPLVPAEDCGFKIDQIVRIGFQLLQPGGASTFTADAGLNDIAAVNALRAAAGATRLTLTPAISNFVIPSSEAQTEAGGDNTTPFGLPIDLGEGPVSPSGFYRNLAPAVKKALDQIRCVSQAGGGFPRIGAFLLNKNGVWIHNVNADGLPVGIPILNYRNSTRGTEGLNQDDKIPFGFNFQPDWDSDIAQTIPDYSFAELV